MRKKGKADGGESLALCRMRPKRPIEQDMNGWLRKRGEGRFGQAVKGLGHASAAVDGVPIATRSGVVVRNARDLLNDFFWHIS